MKKINTKFIAGMLAMALVFGMAGCDNGTNTVTEYVPIGGGGGGTGSDGVPESEYEAVRKEGELLAALTKNDVTVYVLADVTLAHPVTLKPNQHIVVARDSGLNTPVVKSEGRLGAGPLFETADTGVTPALNIAASLTLVANSSLTVDRGLEVNVQTPSGDLEGKLYVSKGASVGVGVDVSGAGLSGTTGQSSLNVKSRASLIFEKDAILAVSAVVGQSKVKLADEASELDLSGAILAVEDGTTDTTGLFGASDTAIIVIPPNAKAAVDVEVYTDVEKAITGDTSGKSTELTTTAKTEAEAATSTSPSQTTATASEIAGLFTDGATKVTYTGTTTLGTVSVPTSKTLIIKGEVGNGTTNIITVAAGGKLVIDPTGSIDFGTAGTITIEDEGTVTNNGTLKTSVTEIGTALNGILAAKGKITATAAITVSEAATLTVPADTELEIEGGLTVSSNTLTLTLEGNGTIAGTITNSGGTIDLGTLSSISPATITNTSGTIKTSNATMLASLLDSVTAGTVEVSESLTIGTAEVKSSAILKIATGKTLTVTGEVTVDAARVTGGDGTATIVIQGSGQLTAPNNFYYSNGTTILGIPITVGTYTWGDSKWTGTATAPATVRNTSIAAEVEWETDTNIVTINYGGTGALTDITVPDGKALIITSEANIANQAAAINKTGSGTITNNGTITTSDSITAAILTNLVSFGGNGTIKLAAGVTGVENTLALSQNLEIGAGGSIAFTGSGDAFSGSSKTVAILVGNTTANALSLGANISGYGSSITVTNAGTDPAAITTATTNVGTLNTLLGAKGKITANAIAVTDDVTLTVPAETALAITIASVTSGKTLTITLVDDGTISGSVTTNSGTIKAAALSTVLGLTGITGKVGITGTATGGGATTATLDVLDTEKTVTLVIPALQTLTVSAPVTSTTMSINNAGTINLGDSGTISGVSGTIVNTGGVINIEDDGELADLLPDGTAKITGGTIVASGAALELDDDATVPGGVTLTLAEDTTLTVLSTKTLTLGEVTTGAEHAATLTLTDDSSQLVLAAGGKVNAANAGSTITAANVTLANTTTAENDNPTIGGDQTDGWSLTADDTGTTAGGAIVLGLLKITVAATSMDITTSQDGTDAGSLTAGTATTITFVGSTT